MRRSRLEQEDDEVQYASHTDYRQRVIQKRMNNALRSNDIRQLINLDEEL